ncbi:MAG: MiaB/RimO family radical SAM methylthiotransferase [Chlorobium sp.]|uniref:MiaB/RimO family radical SAM methylthiotransferase n=1 Tax=Chlorobium sp. TaxID=1095 RepID=UPI0025C5FD4D|nr:MiaB/RimO family radical SAM methylthiotransferase [Chlorobium sp.]MCF8382548.1 MiaB/RimO family radical SAM methylthiotransferase [Chlorobium sp.]
MRKISLPSVAAVTLGCKLNYSETSAILDRLSAEGWQISSVEKGADMIIIHTCAVTKQAEQKCRQKIRQLVRRNPGCAIVVIGCYAQLQPFLLSAFEGVHGVLGSNDKFRTEIYREILDTKPETPLVQVSDPGAADEIHAGYSLPEDSGVARTRAFLKIQDGCDYGCAYCTIPMARGRSRSLPAAMLIERAHALASSGYREIVLTGVNIGDYRSEGTGFAGLLRMLEQVALDRIRVSSLEPDIIDDRLLDVVACSRKIAPHFHVPLQSGSDRMLQAMGRRYTTEGYRERIMRAVESIQDCAIGIDVIAGYPGESEEDFQDMYRFIDELPAAYLHVFSCSIRPGTRLASQTASGERKLLSSREIEGRSDLLIELGRRKKSAYTAGFLGKERKVLVETSTQDGRGGVCCSGYTANYLHVTARAENFAGDAQRLKGMLLPVAIREMGHDLNLEGRLLF